MFKGSSVKQVEEKPDREWANPRRIRNWLLNTSCVVEVVALLLQNTYRPVCIIKQKPAKHVININNTNKMLTVNTDMHSRICTQTHTDQSNAHFPSEPVFALACCTIRHKGCLIQNFCGLDVLLDDHQGNHLRLS